MPGASSWVWNRSSFLRDLAVIALLRFLYTGQVLLELLFVGPGRAVNALQHFVARVPAPVGTRHLGQFEGLQLASAGHMRAAAQISPGALGVQRNFFACRQAFDNLYLVVFAHVAKFFYGFFPTHHDSLDRQIQRREFFHPLLDLFQILGREIVSGGKIVVKTVLDYRADGDLHTRKQLLRRHCQQMGGGVTNDLKPGIILVCDDRNRGIVLYHMGGIHLPAIYHCAQRGLGQARTDIGGDIVYRYRLIESALATVGQCNNRHERSLYQWWPLRKVT